MTILMRGRSRSGRVWGIGPMLAVVAVCLVAGCGPSSPTAAPLESTSASASVSADGGASAPTSPHPTGGFEQPSPSAPTRGTPTASPSAEQPPPGGPASGAPSAPAGSTGPTGPTEQWADNAAVSHLFFHSLVVNPQMAFADQESGNGYLDYMVTVSEFTKILQQVYNNGYVLVSPHQLASVGADGAVTPTPLMVPVGKKPLVLSIDDVSYYEYMAGDGFASKLVVSSEGSVLNEYTDPVTGKTTLGAYDVMPIVDRFVATHPDFAPWGHKGVIALTGYNGVLGYRSSPSVYQDTNPHLPEDIAEATRVAEALKASGWEFASHTWGHIDTGRVPMDRLRADTERWRSDVEPIVGPTDLLIYAFGADISGIEPYAGERFEYLKSQGFSFYFNIDGSRPSWGQWGKGYLREARINVDGISMAAALAGRPVLGEFFDVASVIDPARPPSIHGSH